MKKKTVINGILYTPTVVPDVLKDCLHNIKVQQIQKEHFKVPPQPMEFIAMDLIGEFHPPSSKGNRYALTAVCMLTGFTFCILIKSNKAEDVMKAYTDNICCVFGPLKKVLTDNGTEFKNKLWTDVFKRMRTEHRTSTLSPTHLLTPV